ncbi:low molecular weight phosphatase family protein [Haloprofundus halobius]|uniref:arsenate-mycothiol transferase ArsC n=1 Tax=Haloprofundus halobius TaxID=2876194 RepID=UPI001CCA6CE1|nr:low molecular weight phosphatase family protein [Haloprofundus halobius]
MSAETSIAFVCVQNAGRSQMAAAFAEREVEERDVGDRIRILTGGTQPADRVHDIVVQAMDEEGFNLAGNPPREITPDELENVDIVITMGCSADNICPMTWRGDARDWALDDPHRQDLESVREIRDETKRRVSALFDELGTP